MASTPALIATISSNGQIYNAWESVMVRVEYGNPISVFEFTPTEGAYGPSYSNLKIQPGDAVTISLAGHQVINGYVTTRSVSYDEKSHQIVIAGKSKTCDIKDSSVVMKPGNYDGNTFEQAARGVMAPHPVNLVMSNPPASASTPFPSLSVQYGETCAEFITRIANIRGLILSDNANGDLVAGQANASAAPVAQLIEGANILRAVGKLDDQTKFAKLSTAGQQVGNDQNWPPRAISASSTNSDTRPNRYKLIVAEQPVSSQELVDRVNFEQTRSLWPSVECSITVFGWLKPDGTIWKIPDMISIYSPMIFPTASGMVSLCVKSTVFAQDSTSGTTTTLELCLQSALSAIPTAGIPDIGGVGAGVRPRR